MSLRLEMLQVARLSPKLLGESAELVEAFLRSQQNPDGGFKDRSGNSDLYYTVFGMEALRALRKEESTPVTDYLRSFGNGENLDIVHLACLIRCWANTQRGVPPLDVAAIAKRLESYRTMDGGYNTIAKSADGTAYGCFLILNAYQDLQYPMPRPDRLYECLQLLRADDGGYANQQDAPMGLTPSTAAACSILRHLDEPAPAGMPEWLLARQHPDGGFYATPMTPMPDLLSTATALHALSGMQVALEEPVREGCLDFIDTLWTNRGGFYGNWTDDVLDCEYTYYGLLALGHLSV